MTITMKKLAALGNVSVQTVSTAINGKDGIGDDTRKRILALADQLGYRPNATARATRTGRTGCIGILMNPVPGGSQRSPELEEGIVRELARHDLYVAKGYLSRDVNATESDLPRVLREWMADGLLLDFPMLVPAVVESMLGRARVPAVWINNKRHADCVYPDDHGAAKAATEQLLARGHRRIAYVNPRHRETASAIYAHFSAVDRESGYVLAMRNAGLEPRIVMAPPGGDLDANDPEELIGQLLRQPDRPTALVCYSGATDTRIAALRLGLRIPQDLSVVSFCSNEVPYLAERTVARLVVPFRRMGIEAVGLVMQKIKHPERPLPPTVVAVDPIPPQMILPPGV